MDSPFDFLEILFLLLYQALLKEKISFCILYSLFFCIFKEYFYGEYAERIQLGLFAVHKSCHILLIRQET